MAFSTLFFKKPDNGIFYSFLKKTKNEASPFSQKTSRRLRPFPKKPSRRLRPFPKNQLTSPTGLSYWQLPSPTGLSYWSPGPGCKGIPGTFRSRQRNSRLRIEHGPGLQPRQRAMRRRKGWRGPPRACQGPTEGGPSARANSLFLHMSTKHVRPEASGLRP